MKLRTLTETYFDTVVKLRAKSPLTIKKERGTMDRWLAAYGDRDLLDISREDLNQFAMDRGEGVSNRTINLDILALNNVLKFGRETGMFTKELVTAGWKPLKHKTPRRELMPGLALDQLCTEATRSYTSLYGVERPMYRNGAMLADYLKLLAYSGCRRESGLKARWDDVDFGTGALGGTIVFHTKFDKDVVVQMNKTLRAHLRKMWESRRDESPWLFPAPDRTSEDHWANPARLFELVRMRAGLRNVSLHDFRHAYASRAVMAGIDFMTVANMLGHSDGGILVSKVYGHLSSDHLKAAAAKMTF